MNDCNCLLHLKLNFSVFVGACVVCVFELCMCVGCDCGVHVHVHNVCLLLNIIVFIMSGFLFVL